MQVLGMYIYSGVERLEIDGHSSYEVHTISRVRKVSEVKLRESVPSAYDKIIVIFNVLTFGVRMCDRSRYVICDYLLVAAPMSRPVSLSNSHGALTRVVISTWG